MKKFGWGLGLVLLAAAAVSVYAATDNKPEKSNKDAQPDSPGIKLQGELIQILTNRINELESRVNTLEASQPVYIRTIPAQPSHPIPRALMRPPSASPKLEINGLEYYYQPVDGSKAQGKPATGQVPASDQK